MKVLIKFRGEGYTDQSKRRMPDDPVSRVNRHPNEFLAEETFDDDADDFYDAVKVAATERAASWGQYVAAYDGKDFICGAESPARG